MFEDLHSDGATPSRKRTTGTTKRQLVDREVPLGPPTSTISQAVHAWLDGTTPERDARRGEWSRDVDFWKRLDDDLAARRRMRTPNGLEARIMNAIPQHAPTLITPWWRREFVVTPSSAIIAVATLMAASIAATALVMR